MSLSKQASYIYNILSDWEWHCGIDWGYSDGHAKRITDINEFLRPQGLEVDSKWCNCGRHVSKVLARRIKAVSSENPVAQKFLEDFGPFKGKELQEQLDKLTLF
jgi:hypothetical protein